MYPGDGALLPRSTDDRPSTLVRSSQGQESCQGSGEEGETGVPRRHRLVDAPVAKAASQWRTRASDSQSTLDVALKEADDACGTSAATGDSV